LFEAIISTILFALVLTAGAQDTQDFTEDELKLIATLINPYISVNWGCIKDCVKDAFPCALKSTPLCLLKFEPITIATCVGIKCGIQGAFCMAKCFKL